MDLEQFLASLASEKPPGGLSLTLAGLWWDAKGNWIKAHESAQQDEGLTGSWVHGYLHRKEGDSSDVTYWYGRGGEAPPRTSLEEEWQAIEEALLPHC
jgi:hypothetical protein